MYYSINIFINTLPIWASGMETVALREGEKKYTKKKLVIAIMFNSMQLCTVTYMRYIQKEHKTRKLEKDSQLTLIFNKMEMIELYIPVRKILHKRP